jgi:CRISPR-associated protein Cas1
MPTLRVMALHALVYCERLFYLEEIEEIRVADERVYAGRTLHESLEEDGAFVEMTLESEALGIRGRMDALRRRDGALIPYEHKRGRSRSADKVPGAWDTDRIQLGAYAMLLEEASGRPIAEGRIRYHADKVLVRVPIDAALREQVRSTIRRAQELAEAALRPPVTTEERRCASCSLAPVCLPEESRRALDERHEAARLFPARDERRVLHVVGHGSRVGRSGSEIVVTPLEGKPHKEPIAELRSIAVHGNVSVSTQALQLAGDQGIPVHFYGGGGWFIGTFYRDDDAVQRRIRQYEALREPGFRLSLARRLVHARLEGQLRFVLRATRGGDRPAVEQAIGVLRDSLAGSAHVESPDSLLGFEGRGAAAYFSALPALLPEVDPVLRPQGRSRRPPEDRFNALLSFGYALVMREVSQAIRLVGLDGAFGFYHRPRSAAPPLVLDLLELFRVPVVDMAVVAAVNRRQFDPAADFVVTGKQVWLSPEGRKKLIEVIERRLDDTWRHPMLDYSLSYRRHIELEVRLLEKEWCGDGGLFARTRLR